MSEQNKNRRISVSAIRRANENLVSKNKAINSFSENQSTGHVVVRAVYSGRNYEIDLSSNEIKVAYAKSIKAQLAANER